MGRMDAINKQLKEKDEGFSQDRAWYINTDLLEELGMKQFKAKEGSNFLRVLPPLDSDTYFGLRIFVHYNLGPNGNDAFLCPRMMKNERCVICERQDELKAKNADADVIKGLGCFPPRYLFLVRDCKNDDTMDEGAQVYDAPQTVNNEILSLSKDRRSGEVIDISDPDTGKLLCFDRVGTKAMNTRYSAFGLEKDDPIPDEWLNNLPTLEECLLYGTEEAMLAALGLGSDTPETAEVVEESEAPDARRGRRTRAPRTTETVSDKSAEEPPAEEPPAEEPPAEEPPATRRQRRAPRGDDTPPPADAPAEGGGDDVRSRLRERLANRNK